MTLQLKFLPPLELNHTFKPNTVMPFSKCINKLYIVTYIVPHWPNVATTLFVTCILKLNVKLKKKNCGGQVSSASHSRLIGCCLCSAYNFLSSSFDLQRCQAWRNPQFDFRKLHQPRITEYYSLITIAYLIFIGIQLKIHFIVVCNLGSFNQRNMFSWGLWNSTKHKRSCTKIRQLPVPCFSSENIGD